jgi:3-methyladenine DNA glycosylase AlkD
VNARAIERRLRALGDRDRARHSLRFFRTGPGEYGEGDRFLGLTVPDIRAVAREAKDSSLDALEQLLQSPWHEVRLLALVVLVEQHRRGDAVLREAIHQLYLRNTHRINSWDLVDCSAAEIVGAHLRDGGRSLLDRLARSASLWERRMAMIATADSIKRDDFRDALRIAAILVGDEHDLIHKATGWMLREIGKRDRAAEEKFLRKYASRMPRTMLRYAIERFPERLRRQYLAGRT